MLPAVAAARMSRMRMRSSSSLLRSDPAISGRSKWVNTRSGRWSLAATPGTGQPSAAR